MAAFAGNRSGIRARVETVWDDDELVAVWPLMLVPSGGVRVLQGLGEPHTQYCNLLYDAGRVGDPAAQLLIDAVQAGPECDVAVLQAVPECSPLARVLPRRFRTGGTSDESSVLDLACFASAEDYSDRLSPGQRRGRKRRRKHLSRLGPLSFRVLWPGDPQFGPLVRDCAAMKRRWLAETGRISAGFRLDGFDDFLAGLAGDRATLTGACLSVLQAGDRVVAIEIGFIKDRHYYCYMGGFDWDIRSLSPGKVQMDETVRWLIENRIVSYDLLGNPADYKRSWSNRSVALHAYTVPFTWKGHVYAGAWLSLLRPAAKRLYEAAPMGLRRLVTGLQSFGLLLLHV